MMSGSANRRADLLIFFNMMVPHFWLEAGRRRLYLPRAANVATGGRQVQPICHLLNPCFWRNTANFWSIASLGVP
jgi:hypothetical protein